MNGLKSKELLSAAKTQARMCTYEVTHLENAFICFASDQRIANDVNLDRMSILVRSHYAFHKMHLSLGHIIHWTEQVNKNSQKSCQSSRAQRTTKGFSINKQIQP